MCTVTKNGIVIASTRSEIMVTVIATDLAARKRKDTETGGTETKTRGDTSPPAGKQSPQTLLGWRKALADSARSGKSDLVLTAGKRGVHVIHLGKRCIDCGYGSLEEQLANLYSTLCCAYKDTPIGNDGWKNIARTLCTEDGICHEQTHTDEGIT